MLVEPAAVMRAQLPVFREVSPEGEFDVVRFPEFQSIASIPEGTKLNRLKVRQDPHGDADGVLGMPWFADRVWLFDYLGERLMFAAGDEFRPSADHTCTLGFLTDANGVRQISFPRIQATVDGETIDFLFDTGATLLLSDEAMKTLNDELPQTRGASFITNSIFETWSTRHPDWLVIDNADTLLNESIIRVPIVRVGGYDVGPVWFTRRADRHLIYFSQWMDKPVNGALGGSVFKYFSIFVDYPKALAQFKVK